MGLAATKQEEFWEACGFGNTERVRKLIAEGIDVNWVSYTVRSLSSEHLLLLFTLKCLLTRFNQLVLTYLPNFNLFL